MSIRDLMAKERLFDVAPGVETPRKIYMTTEVLELFEWDDTRDGWRKAQAAAVLEAFVDGCFTTVATNPFDKEATAIMARVHPVEKEVFDFRCLDPMPGIRVLGCFSDQDEFIALTWDYRENFESSEDWITQVDRCAETWTDLFDDEPPLSGEEIDAYLSFNFKTV